VPFALTFIAAWLRRYPYGDSARLCQHLAPATCLLTGAGLASVLSGACRTIRSRSFAVPAACGVLVAVGLAGILRDLVQPFKTVGDQECRRILRSICAEAGPCPIVLLNDWKDTQPELVWYLFTNHANSYWRKTFNWGSIDNAKHVFVLRLFDQHGTPPLPSLPPRDMGAWMLVGREVHSRPLDQHTGIIEMIEVLEYQ
jgi:hypothetical protein